MDEPVSFEQLIPFFRQLPGYRVSGQFHMATCPTHADKIQSLSLSKRGVLKCYAGCKFVDLMNHFRGMGMTEDTPQNDDNVKWELVNTYEYTYYDGKPAGVKIREEAVRTNGRTKRFAWKWHDAPMKSMPLWGWQSIGDNECVIFTEGEKACDALISKGYAAVAVGSGAGDITFDKAIWEPLKGKDVIIWRDNDEPGRLFGLALARQLFGVARSVRIICWGDGGYHADAADACALAVDIEGILAERSVSAEMVEPDHIRVTVQTDIGPAMFDFEDIHSVALDDIRAELTVSVISPQGIDTPYNTRINLLSMSGREGLGRELGSQFGKEIKWTGVISQAWGAMNHLRKDSTATQPLRVPSQESEIEWVIEGIVPAREDSILFAPEGSGKSLMYVAMAAAVATGRPFAGTFPVTQGGVLIVDYERDEETFTRRLARVLRGMGISPTTIPTLPIRFYAGNGVALTDQVNRIRRAANEIDASLVFIDSLGFAVGGDLFAPQSPINFYRKRLGRATMAIGQVPAADEEKLFGSRYWMFAPHGAIWRMRRTNDASDRTQMYVDMVGAKPLADLGMLDDVSIQFTFRSDGSIGVFTSESRRRDLVDRITSYLGTTESAIAAEIARAVEWESAAVWNTLRDYDGRNWESFTGDNGVDRWRIR